MPAAMELYVEYKGELIAFRSLTSLAVYLGADKAALSKCKRLNEKKNRTTFCYAGTVVHLIRPEKIESPKSRALLPNLCTHRLGYNPSRW
jgi:hypothetical protein